MWSATGRTWQRRRPKPCRVRTAAISGTYLTKIINKHAAEDALFTADDGTAAVWMLRHIDTGGKRRTFASLLHGTMASGMPSALGLQKCQPGRQVICLAGDGGFAMLLGDLLTTVQENLPIKIVVYDNGKLGFVDIEQKAAGLVPVYTDLKNPDFGEVAKAMGLWGHMVSKAGELEDVGPDLARAARPRAAACEGEADAAGDAALALRFTGGRGRHGGLHRQGDAARQGPRRLGNDRGEYSLTCRAERSVSRPRNNKGVATFESCCPDCDAARLAPQETGVASIIRPQSDSTFAVKTLASNDPE